MKTFIIPIFCFFSFGLVAQIPTYIPTNGLVGWWPFNGNANDESGNGNHGTINGASFTIDRNGSANKSLNLNGLNDFVEILTNNSFDNNTFSISFWVKTNTNQIETSIISRLETRNDNISVYQNFVIFQTGIMVALNGGCVWTQGYSSPSIISSSWRHVVYVNTPTNSKLYIDNQLIQNYTSQSPQNMTFYSYPMRFGKSTHSFWKDYNGLLDDVSIYNRTLSVQEINTLYQGCSTPTATITPQTNTNFCQGNNVILNATTGANYTYEWYKNSSLISGATTNSYAATTAGNYTVKVIDGSCNATSSATTLTLIDTVIWTGNVDNDWHKPCNWSPEVVPECCNSVKIPFTPISPVVSGVGKAKNVTLYSTSGATLTVNNGANLQIETCPVNKTENSCPTLPVLTTTVISSATQTSAVSGGNITYTGASSITARGVCWSTTTAPTIANSKSTDGSGTGTFTSNLTSLTGGTTYYVRAYATNASGTSYGNEVSFIAVNPQPAYPLGSVFCNGSPTLVVDVTNPTTGKTWMDRNLGASQVATSSSDAAAYGDLYQWGRGSDGHQCRNSLASGNLSSTDQPTNGDIIFSPVAPSDWRSPKNDNLWQGVNGVNNPCPINYRLPTEIELDAERISWSPNNSVGAFASPLKLTMGGRRNFDDSMLTDVSNSGNYWSSSVIGDYSRIIYCLIGSTSNYTVSRAHGYSVRCIKN